MLNIGSSTAPAQAGLTASCCITKLAPGRAEAAGLGEHMVIMIEACLMCVSTTQQA